MPETQPKPSTFTHLWLKPDVALKLWHSLWVEFTCILLLTQALEAWRAPPWCPSACAVYFQRCLCGTVSPVTEKFRSKTLLGRSLLWLICAREGRVSFSFLQLGEVPPLPPRQAKSLTFPWAAVRTQCVWGWGGGGLCYMGVIRGESSF